MMTNKEYSVYAIRNNVNCKVYVGITKTGIHKRFVRHVRYSKNGSENLIHRAMRKYGVDKFYIESLVDGISQEEAADVEKRLIKALKANSSGGYNIMAGGQTGLSNRPETRRKKSIAAKEAWLKSDKWQQAIHCPERKRKIGDASRKLFENPEYRAAFDIRHKDMVKASTTPESMAKKREPYISNGNNTRVQCSNGMVFDMVSEAARLASSQTGLKTSGGVNIIKCAKGFIKTAYGFSWSFPPE